MSEYETMRRFDAETKKWNYIICRVDQKTASGMSITMVAGEEFNTEAAGEKWAKETLAARPWVTH